MPVYTMSVYLVAFAPCGCCPRVARYANGHTYDGEFHSGQFHGSGRYVYANGQGWYEGLYVMGRQHGAALRVFANNNRYDGAFENNEPEGEGIMEYANGDGEFGYQHKPLVCSFLVPPLPWG